MSDEPGVGIAGGVVVGLGIDLVDIERLERILQRRPAMADRLFAPEELDYAGRLVRPGPSLAGRFAVKEAAMKALRVGIGAVDWTDFAVIRRPSGAPDLAVRGRAAARASELGVTRWEVSISHTATVAAATVAALA